jgi:predicted DNA-binding transcriptional regulator YafY
LGDKNRIFRIDRIQELNLKAETYKLPDEFSLAEELDNAWGVEQGKEEMEDISENEIIFKVKTNSRKI